MIVQEVIPQRLAVRLNLVLLQRFLLMFFEFPQVRDFPDVCEFLTHLQEISVIIVTQVIILFEIGTSVALSFGTCAKLDGALLEKNGLIIEVV
jgi:hypothetical protein